MANISGAATARLASEMYRESAAENGSTVRRATDDSVRDGSRDAGARGGGGDDHVADRLMPTTSNRARRG